jgi:hypothetical protein
MTQHKNARAAIRLAASSAPSVVGWKAGGWVVYNPTIGAPKGVEPEIFVAAPGVLPVALTDVGATVLRSALSATQ